MYFDESGVADTLSYAYGWAQKGQRCFAQKLGHATQRLSMMAAWSAGKMFAAMTFEGYCDSVLVETYVKKVLLPELGPGQTLILDNASFHRKAILTELLATLDCELLPLAPYSPDLNKIEPLGQRIKSELAKIADPALSFHDKLNQAFVTVASKS